MKLGLGFRVYGLGFSVPTFPPTTEATARRTWQFAHPSSSFQDITGAYRIAIETRACKIIHLYMQ